MRKCSSPCGIVERDQRAQTRGRKTGKNRQRMNETLIKDAEDQINNENGKAKKTHRLLIED